MNIIINYYFTSYDILIKSRYIEYIFHKHLAFTELNIDLRDQLHINSKNEIWMKGYLNAFHMCTIIFHFYVSIIF